jgi:hypothetical protein
MMAEANYKASGESFWVVLSFNLKKVYMYECKNTAQN